MRDKPFPERTTAASTPYPAITLADGSIRLTQSAERREKTVRFEMIPVAFSPIDILGRIVYALELGARVLVVMNTVQRALNFMKAVESSGLIDPQWQFSYNGVRCPHHGRFAPEDRLLLDAVVSKRLGRRSPDGPLLLIGTQT